MRLTAIVALLIGCGPLGAAVVDRVEVAIGTRVITLSDVDLRIRLTAFQNHARPEFSTAARKEAVERLIDQSLIEREMEIGRYENIGAATGEAMLGAFQKENFPAGQESMNAALNSYGLTGDDLTRDLKRQANLLTFIDLRFRPAISVTDEEIRKYFDEKVIAAAEKQLGVAGMRDRITQAITSQRADQEMDTWLRDQRGRTRISYVDRELAPK